MKQTDALKRIEMPNPNTKNGHVCYKNKLQPEFDFESEELKAVYQQHEAELLSVAEKEAWDYLLDVGAWDSEPGEDFPCGKEMTGEWYVGRVTLKSLKNQIYGSIDMRFLGYYSAPTVRSPIDDYLGMEYTFYYEPNTDTFEFDGFNTSAI
ncbi:hypothetical protein D3Z58_25345 [Clostridiaceae bacterium]|nr:hypothetical protein [Lachnospiraceae bacterium]NBH36728.1 hypothetical protein [Clostridiaceae bacterium]